MITEALVIDIETRTYITPEMAQHMEARIEPPKNYRDQDKINAYLEERRRAAYEKAALSPLTAEVAVVGIAWRSEGATEWEREVLDAREGEEKLLRALDERMTSLDPRRVVTFNGTRFDIPFLAARYTIRNLSSYPWPTGRDYQHIDLFRLLGEQGSLEQWSIAIGLGWKGVSGADVPALIAAGEWDTVREHCMDDVNCTAALYDRVVACCRIVK